MYTGLPLGRPLIYMGLIQLVGQASVMQNERTDELRKNITKCEGKERFMALSRKMVKM